MLKKISFILIVVVHFAACKSSGSKGYDINGALSGEINSPLILSYYDGKKAVALDTAIAVDGKFTFSGTLDHPVMLIIQVEGKRPTMQIFGENSRISVTGNIDSLALAKVEGSLHHKVYMSFKEEMKIFENRTSELRTFYGQAMNDGNQEKALAIYNEFEALEITRKENTKQFITLNSTSPVAAYLALNVFQTDELTQQKEVFSLLNESLASNPYYKILTENIARLNNLQIGKKAPEFTLKSSLGEEVALSSLQGSYVLVDFWASWCGPCRRENPNVVKEYHAYKSKGFTVLSVSVDSDQDAWRKAIEEDGLVWTQLIDTIGMSADVYGVRSIPTTYLLNKEGVIIATNLRGDQLTAKLEDIFN